MARVPAAVLVFIAANALFTLGNSSDAFLALRSLNLGLTLLALLLTIVAFNATNSRGRATIVRARPPDPVSVTLRTP